MELERRPLGNTGLDISVVGLGGGGLPASDEDAKAVTSAFLKGGVNFVDTSPNYGGGTSEAKLGRALADVPRSSYVLQTKIGDVGHTPLQNGGYSPFSRKGVLASVNNSLELLKIKSIDSLLLHDPYADELDEFLAKGGGMEAVRELRSAGIVKHFGCGAREHEPHVKLLEALGPSEFQVAQTVDDENPIRRFLDQLELKLKCEAAGVGIINAAPLYRGLMVDAPTAYHSVPTASGAGHYSVLGVHSESHEELAALAMAMGEWSRGQGVPLLHLAVRWPIEACTHVACSPYGCGTVAQVKGVLKYATTPLPEGFLTRFEAEFGERVAALGPEKHFYWFKQQTSATKEWSEMAVYPRATWGHAFADK